MKVEFKTVRTLFDEFKDKSILIPSYQRGYRWREEEVEALLSDIKNEEAGYCLQPIVFKGDAIVDGQQRLTTITLIRKELGCEDGKVAESLLNTDRDEIDNCFIGQNEAAIEKFLNGTNDKESFKDKLNACFFIKCMLDENEKGEDVFMRLNAGKIPLSSAEILKAYYLTEGLRGKEKEIFISGWREIEKALQDDSFYFFFSHDERKNERYYSSRMDFLLEVYLLLRNKDNAIDFKQLYEASPIFAFTKIHEVGTSADNMIASLKEIMQKMERIYSDIELYNLYGYLSCKPNAKDSLFLLSDVLQEEELLQKMKEDANNSIDFSKEKLEALSYYNNKDEIKSVLLLHNAIESIRKGIRFDYNMYRNTDYNLEHIHARAELKNKNDVDNFCKDVLERYKGKDVPEGFLSEFKAFCDSDSSQYPVAQAKLEQWEECIWVLDCNGKVERSDSNDFDWRYIVPKGENEDFAGEWRYSSIRNLCLLSASVNKSIGNNSFAGKRKRVTEAYLKGAQLPIVTAAIFSVFRKNSFADKDDSAVWTRENGDRYLNAIAEALEEYLK